ncbi:MAG: hypothetical protein RL757_3148 [Bacteroidota bacterium]|jgi:predicted dehydrogenase
MRKIRWAIVGLGKIATKFATDMQLVEQATLVAVASRNETKAQDFAAQFNAPFAFGNYADLLKIRDQIDVVYIATPHVLHGENSLFFLENGFNVLCEKPLGMNLSEVENMQKMAKKHNVFLMEAMWTRMMPSFLKMQELLADEKNIGKLGGLTANFGFPAPFDPMKRAFGKQLGGGSLLDIGIYPVMLALTVFGKPTDIKATVNFSETGVDQDLSLIFKHQNGEISNLQSSFIVKMPTDATIFGTTGYLHLHSRFHHSRKITISKAADDAETHFEFPQLGYGYEFEIAEVCQCIEKGWTESPRVSWQFSHDLMEILDEIRQKIGLHYD